MAEPLLHITIITGLSGAGKTLAVDTFEDAGYFCVDNMPPQMLPGMADLFSLPGTKVARVALVFDIRGREFFCEFDQALKELERRGIPYRIIFLEADEETLISRYQATRRAHPLSETGSPWKVSAGGPDTGVASGTRRRGDRYQPSQRARVEAANRLYWLGN